MRFLTLLLLFVALLAPTSFAHAAPVSVNFCAELLVDYLDADVVNPHDSAQEGDFFYTNSPKVARGVRIKVTGPGVSQELFADWSGADVGCAGPYNLNTQDQYDVRIVAIAEVNGNTIRVFNNQDDRALWSSLALNDWSPTASGDVAIQTANQHDAWNVLAAASHAMWRRNGAMTNKTYDFHTEYDLDGANADPCGDGDGSCHRYGDVHLSSVGVNKRFIIVHEMGHALGYFAAGAASAPTEYDLDPDNCFSGEPTGDSHEMNSKEWQSAAIVEGWAHFYAAVAFNVTTELDCGFVYYKSQDYDVDSLVESPTGHTFSCEAGPSFSCPGCVDAKDYLGDMCDAPRADRATEMDWLRFWWDFLSEESATVSFDDCVVVYAVAVLGTYGSPPVGPWDPTPDGTTPNQDRPYVHMEEAADYWGLATEWANHVDNGVDR